MKGIYDSWPPDDEMVAGELVEHWRQGARVVKTGAEQVQAGGAQAVAAWPDEAGATWGVRVDGTVQRLRSLEPGAAALADRAQGYAEALTTLKGTIVATIALNTAAYSVMSTLPMGALLQQAFATQVATMLKVAESTAAAGLTGAGAAAPTGPVMNPTGGFVTYPDDTPAKIKDRWNALPKSEQDRIIRDYPESVGNLDGIPIRDRNRANHILLDRAIAGVKAEMNGLDRRRGPQISAGSVARSLELRNRLNGLQLLRDNLTPLKANGDPMTPADRPPMYLIGLDPAGDGKAITSLGNPDTATNTATFIPGVNSSLNGDDLAPIPLWTRSLYDAIPPGSPDTAVVMWLGYDPPDSSFPAALEEGLVPAAEGADDLNRFQEGLAATHTGPEGGVRTIVGHSYGGALASIAAQRNPDMEVDRLVLLGSPGGTASDVTELNVEQVYAAGDATSDLAGPRLGGFIDPLGWNPDTPEFGAQILVSPNTDHFKYFMPGDPIRDDVGRIIAGGRPD